MNKAHVSPIRLSPTLKSSLRPAYYLLLAATGMFRSRVRVVCLETSSMCNCRCPMCAVPLLKRSKGLMTYENFCTIAQKLPPSLRQLKLAYAGEPLLNPDIFKMVRYFRTLNKTAVVRISTNGTRLDQFDPKEILESGVSQLDVAIEGSTAEVHEDYRRGSSFDSVCASLAKLCACKRQLGLQTPTIVQMTLLHKESVRQLADVKKLAKELGVDELHLRYMVIPGMGLRHQNAQGSIYDHLNSTEMDGWSDKYLAPEQYAFYETHKGSLRIRQEQNRCYSFIMPLVLFNGDTTVCSHDGDGAIVFGNLLKDSFDTVISKMPALRVWLRNLSICKSCAMSNLDLNYEEIDMR